MSSAKDTKNCRRRKKAWMDTLKNRPCTDCEKQYPSPVMDWDHVHGEKEFSLGDSLANNIGRERILAEIEKCELVCSNCHRLRHMAL